MCLPVLALRRSVPAPHRTARCSPVVRSGCSRYTLAMEWAKLLSYRRIRELMGGSPSAVNDHRTPFQSDFDRLVFSSPVKRLQDKAQVFPLDLNDAVRTHLTHSLEVSCVARLGPARSE